MGERGEIWVRGLNVMKGYHRNEKATRETIDADGYLHTGDIGFVDDKGIYYIVDRLKELIKAKGFQVAPAELEALFVKHPQVADAAVIGAPADKYGGREADGEVPKAFIILQPGATITKSELSAWLAPQVVSYKNVSPHAIDFVESLPKSASGKARTSGRLRRRCRPSLSSEHAARRAALHHLRCSDPKMEMHHKLLTTRVDVKQALASPLFP